MTNLNRHTMPGVEAIDDPIFFDIELRLEADLEDDVTLNYENKQIVLANKKTLSIKMRGDYSESKDDCTLVKFTGIKSETSSQISIKELIINGYKVHDFKTLLSYQITDSTSGENKKIDLPDVITFNGILSLETTKNKDRMTWFPFTYSKQRTGVVYKNGILNCLSRYGCFGGSDCRHHPPWQKFIFKRKSYDMVAMGCSITAGTGIEKDRTWPRLLDKTFGTQTLNLGVPGSGTDQILNNVKYLIEQDIQFKKLIILFPVFGRRLYRIRRHDMNFNMIDVRDIPDMNIFFQKDELDQYFKERSRDRVTRYNPRRDQLIIRRIINILESNGIDYHVSSWSRDTFGFLEQVVDQKNLLPMFNKEQDSAVGIDGSHPAEAIHEKWAKSIETQLGLGKKTA